LKVLIAEDDLTSMTILKALLKKWGYETVTAEDGLSALELLNSPEGPKLAILDWNMPEMDGIEVCSHLRDQTRANPPYLILLTGNTGTEHIVSGLEAGASDYICKPYKKEELLARIRVGQRMLQLQSELNEAKGILAHQAMHDPLTNVYNRRAITEILQHELSRARRTDQKLCIGMFDLDHFKRINDSYGHEIGDKALIAFVRTVEKTLRGSDYIGRWGGEEFIVVAPANKEAEHNSLFERIREAVASLRIPTQQENLPESFGFTVSAGITCGSGSEEADSLIRAADRGLYMAKDGGRNRVISVSSKKAEYLSDVPGL